MRTPSAAAFAALIAIVPACAPGQASADPCWVQGSTEGRASPLDSATVELSGARAKVCYGAPSARGRQVMGNLIPLGEPWRLGANEATTLHLPFPAELGSVRLEPGVYSLYAIAGEQAWTIVVNGTAERWGIPIDAGVQAGDVARFQVPSVAAEEPVERLVLRFERRGDDAADLVVAWDRTRVTVPLRRVDS